jgi:hypothetical protein
MKERAVFLPTPGDPFNLNFWLYFFNKYWWSEVDKLYIYLNTPADDRVVDYIKGLIKNDSKIELLYSNNQIQHGDALTEMLVKSKEKYIMFIEDDAIVFKKGEVNKQFRLLESNKADMVVSRRGCCSAEIQKAAETKFDFLTYGLGDRGTGFWPCFFWSKREFLEKTDLDFKAKTWQKGDYIEQLDLTLTDIGTADTFVWGSIQLQALKPKIAEVPQYHLSTDDFQDYFNNTNVFDGKAAWFHVGSLSSGVHGVLVGSDGKRLNCKNQDTGNLPGMPVILQMHRLSEAEKLEWERRITFWKMFANMYKPEPLLGDYYQEYITAIGRVISQFGLNLSRIEKRVMLFKRLLNLT